MDFQAWICIQAMDFCIQTLVHLYTKDLPRSRAWEARTLTRLDYVREEGNKKQMNNNSQILTNLYGYHNGLFLLWNDGVGGGYLPS
jgi:hypothetical protein